MGTEASVMWAERMGCEQEREQRNAVVAEGVCIKGEFLKMTYNKSACVYPVEKKTSMIQRAMR